MPGIEVVAAATEQTGGAAAQLAGLLPFLGIAVLFYFLLIRPQRNRARKLAEQQQQVAVGDGVVMQGGIVGTLTELADDEVVVSTTPGVELRFLRQAILQVRRTPGPDDGLAAAADDDPAGEPHPGPDAPGSRPSRDDPPA